MTDVGAAADSSSVGLQSDLLLTTKLHIPRARPDLVVRPRLIEQLDAALGARLTLISAPAGFGKTTLVSNWVHASKRPVAWLSLESGDNDPNRFWTYVIAALSAQHAGVGESTLALLRSPPPPSLESILTALINEISAIPADVTLVLDDYHLIEARPIHRALTFLLDHLPPNMHLIVATRADPPFPLARLRARAQLTELRADDLRFTLEEAATFLNAVMGLDLSFDEVARLEARTEGWVAGLQLAALSLQTSPDVDGFLDAFAGSHRYILDYLTDEVLAQQSNEIQAFLLQTAILDRLSGPLCDAVAERGDSQTLIPDRPGPLHQRFVDHQRGHSLRWVRGGRRPNAGLRAEVHRLLPVHAAPRRAPGPPRAATGGA